MKKIDILIIREAIGLLNSMVECGEKHSKDSMEIVRKSFDILRSESDGE